MKRILLILLVSACAAASAQVYKRIGPDGTVYFSDRPGPDAEAVDVAPAQAISMPEVPQRGDTAGVQDAQDESAPTYTELAIVSPASDEGVRANDGNITVRVALQPYLLPGHTLALSSKGEEISSGTSTTFQLTNMDRGAHTLQAAVMDAEGSVVQESKPVTFFVLRVAVGGS